MIDIMRIKEEVSFILGGEDVEIVISGGHEFVFQFTWGCKGKRMGFTYAFLGESIDHAKFDINDKIILAFKDAHIKSLQQKT